LRCEIWKQRSTGDEKTAVETDDEGGGAGLEMFRDEDVDENFLGIDRLVRCSCDAKFGEFGGLFGCFSLFGWGGCRGFLKRLKCEHFRILKFEGRYC
jgi:hypothetical protein